MSIPAMVYKQSLVTARVMGALIGFVLRFSFEFVRILIKTIFFKHKPNAAKNITVDPPGLSLLGVLKAPGTSHQAEESSSNIAAAFRSFQKGDETVNMRLYTGSNARIESTIKVPRERLHWMRARTAFERLALGTFTPGIALSQGLPFSFDGAQRFFLSAPVQKSLIVATAPQSMPRPMDNAASVPHTRFDTGDSNVVQISGVVVSAGNVVVSPEGKPPYTTFSVVLSSATGDVSMSGEDLKLKFENRVYGIGDFVEIKKTTAKFSVQGKTANSKRTKNNYEVIVLKKASN